MVNSLVGRLDVTKINRQLPKKPENLQKKEHLPGWEVSVHPLLARTQ